MKPTAIRPAGTLRVKTKSGTVDVTADPTIGAGKGERAQYSTPDPEGAEYPAARLPAFGPDIVHRDGGASSKEQVA